MTGVQTCALPIYTTSFQSMRLMEDFLDLAKENTEKDLETCGILGAYLVRILIIKYKTFNLLPLAAM